MNVGCFHTSEIPYVFGTLPDSAIATEPTPFGDFSVDAGTYNAQDTKLAKAISAAWVQFAKTRDPNGEALTPWPAFTAVEEGYLEFGDQIVAKAALRKKQLDFLSDFSAPGPR